MRGRIRPEELLHDPEIKKTARANRKAVRLARSAKGIPRNSTPIITHPIETEPIAMGEPPPPRPLIGDYRLTTYRGHLTHIFHPANPVAFDIKTSVQ